MNNKIVKTERITNWKDLDLGWVSNLITNNLRDSFMLVYSSLEIGESIIHNFELSNLSNIYCYSLGDHWRT